MNIRLYDLILESPKSKEALAEYFNVTTKTIENKTKILEDILYNKKISKYTTSKLLPSQITYRFFTDIILMNVENESLNNDFTLVKNKNIDTINFLLETKELSETAKTLIMLQIAINHSCIISFDYKGNSKGVEKKFVKATQIISSHNKYYLYGIYDKKNRVNVHESRTFDITSITNIESYEYKKNEIFKTSHNGNAFGKYSNKKFALLTFNNEAANYIKRKRPKSMYYEILKETFGGEGVEVKYYYVSEKELLRLLKSWMPHVRFTNNDLLKDKIMKSINDDYLVFNSK